eukprot:4067934-Pleurochrysis_carterae.AAC.2
MLSAVLWRCVVWSVRRCGRFRMLAWASGVGAVWVGVRIILFASTFSVVCFCQKRVLRCVASPASGTSCSARPPDSVSSPLSDPSDATLSGSASPVFSTVPPASLKASARRVSSCGAVGNVASPCGTLDEPSPSADARRCAARSNALWFHRLNSSGSAAGKDVEHMLLLRRR